MRTLTADQRRDLVEHLGAIVKGAALEDAIAAIDFGLTSAITEITIGSQAMNTHRRRAYTHHARTLKLAAGLREQLRAEQPLPGTGGLDRSGFDAALDRIIAAARIEADAYRPTHRRGRKPLEWRDRLIALVFSVYPPGRAVKARGSHFEETVSMLLGWLPPLHTPGPQGRIRRSGNDVEDVHSVIIDALKRRPHPGFTVQAKRPLRLVRSN